MIADERARLAVEFTAQLQQQQQLQQRQQTEIAVAVATAMQQTQMARTRPEQSRADDLQLGKPSIFKEAGADDAGT